MFFSGQMPLCCNPALRLAALLLVFFNHARSDSPTDAVSFNRDIRPILSDRCFVCHGPDEAARQADLRLDVREHATESAIVPGDADQSELIQRVTSTDPDECMPPPDANRQPLSEQQIHLLRQWIENGATYQRHWSLIPPQRPPVPATTSHRARGPIDSFILARLERESVAPSPDAADPTLLRRIHFDLIGLPPAHDDLERFLHDQHPDRLERVVDRLIASPHFGERLAVYWLDLVRYADTVGYHGDQEHHISPYRDYIIDAFNQNVPFDVFTLEQLAGDLLPEPTAEQIVATGYNRVLQTSHEGGVQAREYLAKYSSDRVRNVSEVWLGATMGCAECHDHKFDPFSQRDFYSLAAFFADIQEKGDFKGAGDTTPTKREPEIDVLSRADRDELEEIAREIAAIEASQDESSSATDDSRRLEELRSRAKQLQSRARRTMITKSVIPRDIRVLKRGDWMDDTGEVVSPNVPKALGSLVVENRRPNRVDLAKWLTNPNHPTTSRVFVNRLWYTYFGHGITPILNDVGSQGQWPTHPELLDWMAVEFANRDWDVKASIRDIVTSNTYRQTSLVREDLLEIDPENRLVARQGRPRLPAEIIRDNALAVSGLLVSKIGGPSVRPYQPVGYYKHLNFPKREYKPSHGDDLFRRSLYSHWQRQYLHPTLKALDAPSREECTAQRPESNTPAASLALLNDPQFVEAARAFAERILREGGDNDTARLNWAWKNALSRPMDESEQAVLLNLLQSHRDHFENEPSAAQKLVTIGESSLSDDWQVPELAAWTSVARAIFNLDEMIVRH